MATRLGFGSLQDHNGFLGLTENGKRYGVGELYIHDGIVGIITQPTSVLNKGDYALYGTCILEKHKDEVFKVGDSVYADDGDRIVTRDTTKTFIGKVLEDSDPTKENKVKVFLDHRYSFNKAYKATCHDDLNDHCLKKYFPDEDLAELKKKLNITTG